MTLYSLQTKHRKFKELKNNAAVDAHGYIYVWLLPDNKYIGVGFAVACFSSKGNAMASSAEQAESGFPRFFIRFHAILRQGRHERRQGVVSVLQLFDKRITKQQFKMKEKKKFGFKSQSYEAPHAESVDVAQESILCASPGGDENLNGLPQGFQNDADGTWG